MSDTPFKETRCGIARELRAAVKEVNRLLTLALKSGVMVTVMVDGHPRYDVATYGYTDKTAVADWGLRLKTITARKRRPKGGGTFGPVAYCDWPHPAFTPNAGPATGDMQ